MPPLLPLLPALPLAGFLVLALVGARLPRAAVAAIGVGSVGGAAALALALAAWFAAAPPEGSAATFVLWTWFDAGELAPRLLLVLDPLSLVMTLVVTVVGALIHLYSAEYMAPEGRAGYARFFAYMNLFVAAMLLLVLAGDLLLLLLGWEGVGLCSFLLIGFWSNDPQNGAANARAARKAFVVTRIGDTALLIGLFLLFRDLGTLEIATVLERAPVAWAVGSGTAVLTAALLLGGAVGKSAQVPLQTWLPDAMAGPTPVSALIHAATMVTAGVYLVARVHPLFQLAPPVLTATALIGALTLLLAGTSALAQHDIKRVLAYSTISQLGYMFLALGVGAWSAAIFHLVTHAFFKALLFLGAGAVILALHHEQDLRRMGGLRRALPVTFWTFLAAAAALAGLPLVTAGFYSKDLILWRAWSAGPAGPWLWAAGLAGALLTATYIGRATFLAFFGERRGGASTGHDPDAAAAPGAGPAPHAAAPAPLRRPGWAMRAPLVVLAALSLVAGFVELPDTLGGLPAFSDFLAPVLPTPAPAAHAGLGLEAALQGAAALAAVLGIVAAWWWTLRRRAAGPPALAWRATGRTVARGARSGWGFDALYDAVVVRPFVWLARVNARDAFESIVWLTAGSVRRAHAALAATQTGRLRWYAASLLIGAVLLVGAMVLP